MSSKMTFTIVLFSTVLRAGGIYSTDDFMGRDIPNGPLNATSFSGLGLSFPLPVISPFPSLSALPLQRYCSLTDDMNIVRPQNKRKRSETEVVDYDAPAKNDDNSAPPFFEDNIRQPLSPLAPPPILSLNRENSLVPDNISQWILIRKSEETNLTAIDVNLLITYIGSFTAIEGAVPPAIPLLNLVDALLTGQFDDMVSLELRRNFYLRAADYPPAATALGRLCLYGLGGPTDLRRALTYVNAQAIKNPLDLAALAELFLAEAQASYSLEAAAQARRFYEEAIAAGNTNARQSLLNLYLEGTQFGFTSAVERTAYLLQELGKDIAVYDTATLARIRGVLVDLIDLFVPSGSRSRCKFSGSPPNIVSLFTEAANEGNTTAQRKLGFYHCHLPNNTKTNYRTGMGWLKKSGAGLMSEYCGQFAYLFFHNKKRKYLTTETCKTFIPEILGIANRSFRDSDSAKQLILSWLEEGDERISFEMVEPFFLKEAFLLQGSSTSEHEEAIKRLISYYQDKPEKASLFLCDNRIKVSEITTPPLVDLACSGDAKAQQKLLNVILPQISPSFPLQHSQAGSIAPAPRPFALQALAPAPAPEGLGFMNLAAIPQPLPLVLPPVQAIGGGLGFVNHAPIQPLPPLPLPPFLSSSGFLPTSLRVNFLMWYQNNHSTEQVLRLFTQPWLPRNPQITAFIFSQAQRNNEVAVRKILAWASEGDREAQQTLLSLFFANQRDFLSVQALEPWILEKAHTGDVASFTALKEHYKAPSDELGEIGAKEEKLNALLTHPKTPVLEEDLPFLTEVSNAGNKEASQKLTTYYLTISPHNHNEMAKVFLKKATQNGNAQALVILTKAYMMGAPIYVSDPEVLAILRQADDALTMVQKISFGSAIAAFAADRHSLDQKYTGPILNGIFFLLKSCLYDFSVPAHSREKAFSTLFTKSGAFFEPNGLLGVDYLKYLPRLQDKIQFAHRCNASVINISLSSSVRINTERMGDLAPALDDPPVINLDAFGEEVQRALNELSLDSMTQAPLLQAVGLLKPFLNLQDPLGAKAKFVVHYLQNIPNAEEKRISILELLENIKTRGRTRVCSTGIKEAIETLFHVRVIPSLILTYQPHSSQQDPEKTFDPLMDEVWRQIRWEIVSNELLAKGNIPQNQRVHLSHAIRSIIGKDVGLWSHKEKFRFDPHQTLDIAMAFQNLAGIGPKDWKTYLIGEFLGRFTASRSLPKFVEKVNLLLAKKIENQMETEKGTMDQKETRIDTESPYYAKLRASFDAVSLTMSPPYMEMNDNGEPILTLAGAEELSVRHKYFLRTTYPAPARSFLGLQTVALSTGSNIANIGRSGLGGTTATAMIIDK